MCIQGMMWVLDLFLHKDMLKQSLAHVEGYLEDSWFSCYQCTERSSSSP